MCLNLGPGSTIIIYAARGQGFQKNDVVSMTAWYIQNIYTTREKKGGQTIKCHR